MSDRSKHSRVVIIELRGFILQSNNLEALTTNMASIDRSFSDEVEHLFVRMGIILNSWSHTNDNSPRGVRSENKYWIINSSELRVNGGLHFMPLIHFKSIVSNGS
jgi:hypothetical protein